MKQPILVGFLHATPGRGKEIFSFEYDSSWLHAPFAQVLDPALQLYTDLSIRRIQVRVSTSF
jgi:serine/threonine-protein kinase HipA